VADLKVAYINPNAVLGALTIQKVEPNLEPSGPHAFDEPVEAKVPIVLGVPGLSVNSGLSLSPGSPPLVAATPHYTQVLDQLWPEFDELEERTAARLSSLLEEVIDEGQRVMLLKQDLWEKLPSYKVPESERQRFDKEFLAYLRRLQAYKTALANLEPESTATDSVYIGLVKRRDGAGPVPDAIMHLYFAQQLGILADHSREMSEGFVGRVMDGLAKVDAAIDRAGDTIERAGDEAEKKLDSWWDRVTRPWKIAGGVVLGAVVLVGGVLLADKLNDGDREPRP
jgi:hypothetical protein